MKLQLLGPVQAWDGHRPVGLGVRKQRFVLAVLALDANRLIPVQRLVELTWPEDPPASARAMIHTHISGLRAILGDAGAGRQGMELLSRPAGYELRCDPLRVDAHRFAELVARAREGGDDQQSMALLEEALSLWRGPALAGAAGEEVRARLCRHLEEARLAAVEDLIEARLRLGRHDMVLDELLRLTDEHPQRPRLTGALMRALHQVGRTPEALEVYQHTRRRLSEELGLEPPTELQELHVAILRNDPTLARPPGPAAFAPRLPVPRQLPADLATFTGRAAELGQLLAACRRRADSSRPPAAVVISAIDGMAGIGKTALAVHAAHRLALHFPDGQVFVDLHGFTQAVAPVAPADALDQVLRSLGVPGERVPHELDACAALYRTLLADRRMLILLDNAHDEAQVQPLLPAAPGCLALITSRHRLAGLDDVRPLSLDLLPADDALALLIRITGQSGPTELLAEIVELCGRLPLAIRIAAARLRAHPSWTAAHLAERLRHQRDRLGELEAGRHSVTAAIDLSYQQLTAGQQRLYRRLGLHPGESVDAYAAAALADTTVPQAERLLDALAERHLLQEPSPGRYRFHDLLRAHAARSADLQEPGPERRAALTRLLDHYAHTASAAVDSLYPYQAEQRPRVQRPATPAPAVEDQARAAAWLEAELANLLAAAGHAAVQGWPTSTLHLSATLHSHLRTRGRYSDAHALHSHALRAARATGDRDGELTALWGLGHIHRVRGQYAPAADCYRQALEVAHATGHRDGEIDALVGLGTVNALQCRYGPAVDSYQQALDLARATGHHGTELYALWGLGNLHLIQGRAGPAAESYQQALDLARATGHSGGELYALGGLGRVHRTLGRYGPAADCYRQALEIARATGHQGGELYALWGLGHAHRAQCRYGPAADHYRRALELAGEIGDRNGQFEALQGLGLIRRATGHPDQALDHHLQALDLAKALGQPDDQARGHNGLANAHHDLGQRAHAGRHWRNALDILLDIGVVQVEEVSTEDVRARLIDLDRRHGEPV